MAGNRTRSGPAQMWEIPKWLQPVVDFVIANWKWFALVGTWGGIVLYWVRSWYFWKRKQFLHQVNFSLNYVEDGVLMLRTLLEDTARQVWLNDYGVQLVEAAARGTTVKQPFLRLGNDDDMDFVKRAVLNVLSERFAAAYIGRALDIPVAKGRFVFGITCEKYGGIRTQKLRVILMRREHLDALFTPRPNPDGTPSPAPESSIRFAAASHSDRLITLRVMHSLSNSKKEWERKMVGEVELGLPMTALDSRSTVAGSGTARVFA